MTKFSKKQIAAIIANLRNNRPKGRASFNDPATCAIIDMHWLVCSSFADDLGYSVTASTNERATFMNACGAINTFGRTGVVEL